MQNEDTLTMPGGKGKRRPSGPLAASSDEDEDPGTEPTTSPSSVNGAESLHSPTTSHVEHDYALPDHDYENVSSPGNSSTASGPTYVRQPGFAQHAHEVTVSRPKSKKKKTALIAVKEGLRKREPTPPKSKPKREPLPMRLRALPQSFWQQPNKPINVSPASAYPVLPPLMHREGQDDSEMEDVRPVTPPGDRERESRQQRAHPRGERKISVANADLLMKLFEGVERQMERDNKREGKSGLGGGNGGGGGGGIPTLRHIPAHHIKAIRGRPKKVVHVSSKTFVSGEDPMLVECVTEKLFPQLSIEQSKANAQIGGNSSLQLITLREGDKQVTLPSLSVEQNYSQMLSELVMHI